MKSKKPLKVITHIFEDHLLCTSIVLLGMSIGFRAVVVACNIEAFDIKKYVGIEFYQLLVLEGVVLGLLWSHKRYRQAEKRYTQTEHSIFLNKINSTYLELVKYISDEEDKKEPVVTNLINSIQASIDAHYGTEEEKEKDKIRAQMLDFHNMDLNRANLNKANLNEANLTLADLTGADLRGADLRKAHLTGAKLSGAYLTEADLRGANLQNATLRGADLWGADFTGANFAAIDFTNATAKGAKGIPREIILEFDLKI